jgi:hypothetical protein
MKTPTSSPALSGENASETTIAAKSKFGNLFDIFIDGNSMKRKAEEALRLVENG